MNAPHPQRHWYAAAFTAFVAITVLTLGFARDLTLPGLYMDSVNPEYMAVKIVNDHARPDTPTLVMPGNIIDGKYPVLAGSYYHGPLQFYVALPIFMALGTDMVGIRVVQWLYAALILLSMAFVARRYSIRTGAIAPMLSLLALDPAFSLAFKTQAYNVMWPLVWMFLAIGVTESWATRSAIPRAWQLLLSGFLMGLSFFCYFVFLFFVPVLAFYLVHCLRDAGVSSIKRLSSAIALSGIGFCIGGLGYVVGYQLAANEFGGWRRFIDYNRTQVHTMAVDERLTTLAQRLDMSWHSMRNALSDHWVSRTVLQSDSVSWLGYGKTFALLLVPLALVAFLRFHKASSRLLELCVGLALSFFLASLFFGSKMAGHHFTLLLPLLYLGIAAGLSDAWPVLVRAPKIRAPAVCAVACCALVFAADSISAQSGFSHRVRETGGVGYYSDAINQYASHAASTSDIVRYFPEWGLTMPFIFLTKGDVETRLFEPTAEKIAQTVCNGRSVEVAYIPADFADKFAARVYGGPARLSPKILTFQSRDRRAMVGAALYSPPSDAAGVAACVAYLPPKSTLWKRDANFSLRLTPENIQSCSDGAVIPVRVDWDVSKSSAKAVSIWVSTGGKRALWQNGHPSGSSITGPWVRTGVGFEILDSRTGERLAFAKIGGLDCQ